MSSSPIPALPLRRLCRDFTFGSAKSAQNSKLDASGQMLVWDGPKLPTNFASLIKETPFKKTIPGQSSPQFGARTLRTC